MDCGTAQHLLQQIWNANNQSWAAILEGARQGTYGLFWAVWFVILPIVFYLWTNSVRVFFATSVLLLSFALILPEYSVTLAVYILALYVVGSGVFLFYHMITQTRGL